MHQAMLYPEETIMRNLLFTFSALVALTACATLGEEGEACTTDADCADGLECHIEEHEEDGDTAADEDHDDHEEGGVCEAHDEDHEGQDHD